MQSFQFRLVTTMNNAPLEKPAQAGRSLFPKMSKKYISQISNLLNLADEPTVKPFELN